MKNYSLHTDLYQINMAYAYYKDNIHTKRAVFELFFRSNPFKSGYAVFAGLERLVDIIENFKFTEEDIDYLRQFNYDESFLEYLRNLKFSGNIKCVREGEVVFAKEPLVIIDAPIIEAQLLETILLNVINFQTLLATKASRIKQISDNKSLLEFGARRAQEMDAAIWGSRAAYIAGFDGTSLIASGKKFGIPVFGTHAHSFVQAYDDEYEAFKKYALAHKDAVFLIDTYDTLNQGVLNAIRVANELGDKINFKGVRIDSGDLAYLSKNVRKILDEAGYQDAKIYVSSDLDEDVIASLRLEGAEIDVYGIGTKLITSFSQAALGGVYKLVHFNGSDVIKISNNAAKITTPGQKRVYRIINENGKAEGDLISLIEENFNDGDDIYLFSELNPHLNKVVDNAKLIDIHTQIYKSGKLVYTLPSLEEIRKYHKISLDQIWKEHLRYKNPAKYYVDLSEMCYNLKHKLLNEKER